MRTLFVLIATAFLLIGFATSLWISSAVFDDSFNYGRYYLWNATDVGSLSFSDTVYFFSQSKIEHYPYPALTMTMIAGAAVRVGYFIATVFGETLSYELHAERWLRFFEQLSPIYKWTPGELRKVQSCPRRREALATNRPTRWATRGAPGTSSYAACFTGGQRFEVEQHGLAVQFLAEDTGGDAIRVRN